MLGDGGTGGGDGVEVVVKFEKENQVEGRAGYTACYSTHFIFVSFSFHFLLSSYMYIDAGEYESE